MGKRHKHRRGSLAFRPRKRAAKQMPRMHSWANNETPCLLGFCGYKAGMTHALMVDDSNSPTKGFEVSASATVLEVPPITIFGIRAYVKDGSRRVLTDAYTSDEKILELINAPKNDGLKKIEENIDLLEDIDVLAFVDPGKTGIGKKKIERVEIGVGGKTPREKLEYAKGILGKEVKVSEVFKPGEFTDIRVVTKGKGWQGAVKRFGVSVQRRKATGKRRHVGTLGPWHPARVMYTTPMAGQMGYHTRTEINKRILKIGENGEEINPKGGFLGYGLIKTHYILVKGSVGGTKKRVVRLRKSIRKSAAPKAPQIRYISLKSKQGN
ncbi:MAG: 50S ribosomal protein L3 [Candidatus Micrarchaeota archaeon]